MSTIKEELDRKAAEVIEKLTEAFGIQAEHKPRMNVAPSSSIKPAIFNPAVPNMSPIAPAGYDKNKITMGRFSIVNRVRGGQVQMRHLVAEAIGYKISDGKLVRMQPTERRRRKIAAKRSAIKRRSKVAQIVRKRGISLRKRKNRFGG